MITLASLLSWAPSSLYERAVFLCVCSAFCNYFIIPGRQEEIVGGVAVVVIVVVVVVAVLLFLLYY